MTGIDSRIQKTNRKNLMSTKNLQSGQSKTKRTGSISIVGAGPGDPDLLTIKALKRLQNADVVLYDALLGEKILQLAKTEAEMIYVGKLYKDGQDQTGRQQMINEQMKKLASEGKKVVRLKAGDPMIFGRGAEEIEFCVSENLNFEVVPGITAGLAAASNFHIPITLRDKNSMALFYTGHKKDGSFKDIEAVVSVLKTKAPVMIYMALKNLVLLANELINQKIPPSTILQIACKVGQPGQQLFTITLGDTEAFLKQTAPPMPALVILGAYCSRIDNPDVSN